ncbi:MAG: T9SS type A sorting domain-containing protein [Saprospiraceae bacterium]
MKLFSTLFLLCFMAMNAQAQVVCTPDTTDLESIMVVRPQPFDEENNPDGGISGCAVIGEPYEFTFTLKIDSTYEVAGIGQLEVDSIAVIGVNGLPEGIDFECGAEDCLYLRNTVSCFILQGTPEANNPVQDYSLTLDVIIYTSIIEIPLTLPDNTVAPGEYNLSLVADSADASCLTTSTDNPLARQLSLQNQPNPFSGTTTIAVNALTAGDFTFEVRDLLGQQVYQREIRLQNGENAFDYNAADLPKGLYLYSISDGENVVSQKMMVQ